jgi:protein-S-isoprenylcysteine O-methyltransferase Ste14
LLIGAWLLYFLIHSLLASLRCKRWVAAHWPGVMPAYRLLFNLQSLVLLLPPLYLAYTMDGPWLWRWQGAAAWVANGVALVALGLFYWTSRFYDSGEFSGLKQWRERLRLVEDQEGFHLSPLHRFVRHPWYFLGLVLLWSRDMNLAFLLSSLAATGYFVLGSRLEERKLVTYHGDLYRRYQRLVPALLPLPWRYLSRSEAEALQRDARGS